MKISLVGFMGTGKSTVGQLLAKKLGLEFLETDQLVEQHEQASISQIFAEQGEKYFRQLEQEILQEILINQKAFVLSTGGGIVLSSDNRKLLQQKTIAILLEATPETIYQRIKEDGVRPLLATENPQRKIKTLLKQRQNYYQEFTHKIQTDGKTPMEIVKEIKNLVGS